MDLQIPGPGAAMAIAAAIAVYAAALVGASDFSNPTKQWLAFSMVGVAVLFGIFTIVIEWIHRPQRKQKD